MSQCGNVVLLTIRFFEVAKFTTLTLLSLLASCKYKYYSPQLYSAI